MAAPSGPAESAGTSRRLTFVAAVLALVAGASFLQFAIAAAGYVREGFPGYYTAARLVAEGRWSPLVYDDRAFAQETLTESDGRIGEIYRPNPPVASLIALPLAGLDLLTARRAWLVLGIALVVATWLLLLAALPALRAPPIAFTLLALTLLWAPLRGDLAMGQVYVPLLALHAAALLAVQRGRGASAGIALGVATAAKVAAIPWLLVALLRRERRLLVAAAITGALLIVATLGFAGSAGWSAWFGVAWRDLTADRPSLAVTAYQSMAGLLRHLLAPDATWNTGAVFDLPLVSRALGLILGAWVVTVTVLVARRARPDLAAALAVTAFVLALNVAQEYTHALLLLPAAVALGRSIEVPGRGRATLAWLAAAIALAAAPLPYRDPAFEHGWVALLAYPRVYGAVLLWTWLVREIGVELRSRAAPALADPVEARLSGLSR